MYSPEDRYCPIAGREIDCEICYEIVMCLTSGFKSSSIPEVEFNKDEETRKTCDACPYSNLEQKNDRAKMVYRSTERLKTLKSKRRKELFGNDDN